MYHPSRHIILEHYKAIENAEPPT